MIDTKFRKYVQPLFNNIGKLIIKLRITPNQITVLAALIGILAGILIGNKNLALGIVFLWVSGLFDALDGTIARLTKNTTRVGAYMDLIFDRMVEAAVIMGFYFFNPQASLGYLLFFISVLFNFTTFMVAGILFKNNGDKAMYYDVGIAERTETFITFTLMAIFPKYLFMIIMIFNIIVFTTGIIRFLKILNYEKNL